MIRSFIDSLFARRCALYLVLAAIAVAPVVMTTGPAIGQIPGVSPPKAPTTVQQEPDPLGRSTPRGTISGFIRVVHRNDYASAVRYMQVNDRDDPHTETMARELKELMDRYFNQPVATISDAPAGVFDDGLPLDEERVGPLVVAGEPFDIILVRIDNPRFGLIWVISARTLNRVSAVYETMEKPWIDRVMPDVLLNRSVLGISLAQLVIWIASLALPFFLLWAAFNAYIKMIRRFVTNPARRAFAESWHAATRWPFTLLCTLTAHLVAIDLLVVSLSVRIVYLRVGIAAGIVLLAWLLKRFAALFFEKVRFSMARRGRTGTESLILLGERLLNVAIAMVAIFLILTVVGVDTKTALAGVGIGGVAIAFGAQKTLENLFGGIFLLTDQVLAIGDTCRISDRLGIVEDITLRSVRLRTQEQTLLSVPAGALAQANIENLTTRSKILVHTTLPLRYGTTVDQLRTIVDDISALLKGNAKIESESARIRLVNFGRRAIELELFAYILTADNMEFLASQEMLLMNVASIVESAGSGFATPTQVVYADDARDRNQAGRKPEELQLANAQVQSRQAS